MSEPSHDLHLMFPARSDILHSLKVESQYYRDLADRYYDLVGQIIRIEGGLDAASDDRLEGLKKQRLVLLDEIAEMIAKRLGL